MLVVPLLANHVFRSTPLERVDFHSPSFGDQARSFLPGDLEAVADAARRHVDAVHLRRQSAC